MRRIAALFGHSDNAEHAIRDQASRPSLSPTGSSRRAGTFEPEDCRCQIALMRVAQRHLHLIQQQKRCVGSDFYRRTVSPLARIFLLDSGELETQRLFRVAASNLLVGHQLANRLEYHLELLVVLVFE